MTPEQFVDKWSKDRRTERSASQEHFLDLCRLLGQPTPGESDPDDFAFEKHVVPVAAASAGSKGVGGFVDVFKRGRFVWEYKARGGDLKAAYRQAVQYRDALDNPPLTVVCDIDRTIVHTHFIGYPKVAEEIRLEQVPERIARLRQIFANPEQFCPLKPRDVVTKELAQQFGVVAAKLIGGTRAQPGLFDQSGLAAGGMGAAHFLMQIMFCLFAEDVGLLPAGLFTRTLDRSILQPERFPDRMAELFGLMRTGGDFGEHRIEFFNGGLFEQVQTFPLQQPELRALAAIAKSDWNGVDPSIFGTLFERLLDPTKRAQIGAHYTSEGDIRLVIDPVILAPLRREWDALKATLAADAVQAAAEDDDKKREVLATPIVLALRGFRERLAALTVLDPACGSGNFLYVALRALLDLDNETVRWAAQHGVTIPAAPLVSPKQLRGIELNPYAVELAQVSVWIGYLQWLHDKGIDVSGRPILQTLDTIVCRDAILTPDGRPADWPAADFIVGNPPFLGSKQFRRHGLSDDYLAALYAAYPDLPNTSDLCCYWFEQAHRAIDRRPATRAGLLATQAIRGGDNRTVLGRIKESGAIFAAWSDKEWTVDGAAVRTSIVAFTGDAAADPPTLDGLVVETINANLTADADLTKAVRLRENVGVAFMGDTKVGPFDVDWTLARKLLAEPNVNGRSGGDVIRPWVNGLDVTRRSRGMWIVDFPPGTTQAAASEYDAAFAYIDEHVRPMRKTARSGDATGVDWWIHQRPRPDMRERLPQDRFIATPNVTKHRLFEFLGGGTLPDHQLIAFARDDDYFFGVLHSSIHELWARGQGTQLREVESGFRYTPTTCFETFPLPWRPGEEDGEHPAYRRVAAAAEALGRRRDGWLNPPEWVAEVAAKVDLAEDFSAVPADVRPLVRDSAIAASSAKDARLKKRTLTNLYNERPAWLRLAHLELDAAVLACYAATDPAGGWDAVDPAVWQENGAGRPPAAGHALAGPRAAADRRVLASLLRLNQLRSSV